MSAFTILFLITFFILVVLASKIISVIQARRSVSSVMFFVVVFSVVFTGSSIFWTQDTTYRVEVVKPLATGWPIPFHYEQHPMAQSWEPSSTSWKYFFYSALISACLWWVGFLLISLLLRRVGVVMSPPSLKKIFIAFIVMLSIIIALNFVYSKIRARENPGINNPVVPYPHFDVNLPNPSVGN